MKTSALTLKEFFRFGRENLSDQVLKQLEATSNFSDLRKKLGQTLRALHWPGAFDLVIDSLGKLLEGMDLFHIMTDAWQEDADFKEFSDPEEYPANETVLVPLANHAIRSEHHPALELLLGDKPLGHLDIRIELTLKLTGFILEITQGRIESIQTGTLSGAGGIFCEGVQLIYKESGEIEIPGKIVCSKEKESVIT